MRRLLLSLSTLGLLGMSVGCTHTAGVCDCNGHSQVAVPVMPTVKPEPIKAPSGSKSSLESNAPPIAQ